jgi:phage terminase large subunit-like protein
MCLNAENLAGEYEIEINAKSLWIMSEGSRFEPLIGNPGDGAGPSCAIIDEFHEHKTSAMYDTMATGMGSRDQPMLLIITTAGVDFGGPCREKRQDVVRILENSVQDETIFAIIFTIDEGDDWTSIESIEKANPNLDVSISRGFLLAELEKAKRNPTKQVAFKTKHLNMWVGAKAAGINMLELQRCQKKIRLTKKYRGRLCFPALDLAHKWDIAAMALLFPGEDDQVDAFFRFWLPEETVRETPNDRYRAWAETGQLIVTPGNVIDYQSIQDEVLEVCSTYQVPCVAYDPWQATQLSQNLMAQGINMVEIRPTVLNFSEPFKELQARIKNQRWRYNDDVFTWMAGNVVATLDKKDNIFPDKERAENKIDGVVAAIMALNRLLSDDGPSVYETRGMLG